MLWHVGWSLLPWGPPSTLVVVVSLGFLESDACPNFNNNLLVLHLTVDSLVDISSMTGRCPGQSKTTKTITPAITVLDIILEYDFGLVCLEVVLDGSEKQLFSFPTTF